MASVSVIIPTYNRKQLLIKTLESIFNQHLKPSEIIVVDDHSTDGTVAYLNEHYSSKVIVITNKGKGPGAARNTGMSVATGSLIKFFDSDDLMTANTLEVQSYELAKSAKAFIYSPYFYAEEVSSAKWSSDNIVLNFKPFDQNFPLWHFMMVDGLFITIPGMLFKKELLDEVGLWRADVVAYEDWDYLFRVSLLEPNPAHTQRCAFVYRLHPVQTTGNNFSNQQRDKDKVIVLQDINNKFLKDTRFTYVEKMAFLNKFYQSYRVTPPLHPVKEMLSPYNVLTQRLVWQWLRIKYKLGRLKTKTDWQPCHGALKSEEQIKRYLSLIYPDNLNHTF